MKGLLISRILLLQAGLAYALILTFGCSRPGRSGEAATPTEEHSNPRVAPQPQPTPIAVGTPLAASDAKALDNWLDHLPPPLDKALVKAHVPEIQTAIGLLESGSPEAINNAMDLLDGGPRSGREATEQKRDAALYFYGNYVNSVIRNGDEVERLQAGRLLRAIARASALEKGSSRTTTALWNMLAPVTQEGTMGGQDFFSVPPQEREQWLLSLPVYARLQTAKNQ